MYNKGLCKVLTVMILVPALLLGCGNKDASGTDDAEYSKTVTDKNDAGSSEKTEKTEKSEKKKAENSSPSSDASAEASSTEETNTTAVIEIDFEQAIRDTYKLQKEYEVSIRSLFIKNLEKASYIQAVPEQERSNYRKIITDAVVDSAIEGTILSSGAKSAVDAICEGKTTRQILDETTKGLVSGAESYVKSTAKDYVKSSAEEIIPDEVKAILDVIPFDQIQWINDFIHVDDTPVSLLNGIVSRQRSDVNKLLGLIAKESFEPGELQYAVLLYDRIADRQKEIIKAGGKASELSGSDKILSLINEYDKCRGKLYYLSKVYEDGAVESDPDSDIDLELFSKYLNGTDIVLPCNYDVEGYREQQKYTEQSGMVGQKAFGALLGSMASDDIKNSQSKAQQNRITFCTRLEGSLEDISYNLCISKGYFDELYYAADNNYAASGKRAVTKEEMYEAATTYLDQVYRYIFDYENATMLWKTVTSDYNKDFVTGLEDKVSKQYEMIQNGIDDFIIATGYESDEEYQRYVNIINAYADYLEWSMVYRSYEPQYGFSYNVTAYHVGTFDVTPKGQSSNLIVLQEEQMHTNYHKKKYLWVYDAEGNPIYIDNQFGKTYIHDNQMVSFTGDNEDVAFTLKLNADSIYQDILSGNIAHGYENYVLE